MADIEPLRGFEAMDKKLMACWIRERIEKALSVGMNFCDCQLEAWLSGPLQVVCWLKNFHWKCLSDTKTNWNWLAWPPAVKNTITIDYSTQSGYFYAFYTNFAIDFFCKLQILAYKFSLVGCLVDEQIVSFYTSSAF